MKALFATLKQNPGGFDSEKQYAIESLIEGNAYTVKRVNMGQSTTSIYLEGFNRSFNSCCLDILAIDVNGNLSEYDIWRDPDYNPYIRGLNYAIRR